MLNVPELLHSAYSFVRSVESNKGLAAVTLEHVIQEQIERIEGGSSRNLLSVSGSISGERLSKLAVLDRVEDGINSVIQYLEDRVD